MTATTRHQWLARFANSLENRAFVVQDAQVRHNSGRFRLTLVAVRSTDRWRLANAHIGPLPS
jgi:hypothetical protein